MLGSFICFLNKYDLDIETMLIQRCLSEQDKENIGDISRNTDHGSAQRVPEVSSERLRRAPLTMHLFRTPSFPIP